MIPLVIKASFEDNSAPPFVARVGLESANNTAALSAELPDVHIYQYREQSFSVASDMGRSMNGDVIFANPATGTLHRWLRSGSSHNTLLVTERCDQLCQMCSQPPRKTHLDMFDHLKQACLLAEPCAQIGFSGGEPLLFKQQLFELLETVGDARPDLTFHILTNAQHFDTADVERLRLAVYSRVKWGIPLYSDQAAMHDQIVAKPGAFAQLMSSFALLAHSGQSIELRTVLLRENYSSLPELARMVSNRLPFISTWAIMQMERIGFARNRWADLFVDHSAQTAPLDEAVSIATSRSLDVALFNMPYCTVSPALRPYLHASISDWKNAFSSECKGCTSKSLCAGFFAWHATLADYERAGPIR